MRDTDFEIGTVQFLEVTGGRISKAEHFVLT